MPVEASKTSHPIGGQLPRQAVSDSEMHTFSTTFKIKELSVDAGAQSLASTRYVLGHGVVHGYFISQLVLISRFANHKLFKL